MNTGICIAGPAWIVRVRNATPAANSVAVRFTSSASTISPNRSTPPPVTCIPVTSATTNSRPPDQEGAEQRRDRVAGEDPQPVRRAEQQSPREPALEVGGDAEAGEHAAERARLQQHEHELERRVAGREVEAGDVAHAREAARERGEEEQREDDRGEQERRVGEEVVDRAPRDRVRHVEEAPHVRTSLVRRAKTAAVTLTTTTAPAIPNPSAIACPSQPVMTNERMPSTM